jgi:hypothetical protein
MQLTAEQHAVFKALPRVHDDAGEELTRLAQELRDKNPKLTFALALERTVETRPDLADEHINFDLHAGKGE